MKNLILATFCFTLGFFSVLAWNASEPVQHTRLYYIDEHSDELIAPKWADYSSELEWLLYCNRVIINGDAPTPDRVPHLPFPHRHDGGGMLDRSPEYFCTTDASPQFHR